jgi:hypothetical protein
MIGRRLSALALLLSCASAPLHASVYSSPGADCWQRSELEALKVQQFKTMLLVGMLNCREMEPAMAADYNDFVRANRNLIASKQAVVREHFIRRLGPSAGLNAYSAFETSLGNRYSDADFNYDRCANIAQDARMAGYASSGELMDMAMSLPDEDRLAMCSTEPRYAVARSNEWAAPIETPAVAETVAPAPTPAQAVPAVQTAENEWPDLAPVESEGPARAVDPNQVRLAEAAPPPPAAMPERTAEPVKAELVQVASVEVKPAVNRTQAVRDAARALREALAALEAEESATVQ